MDAHDRLHIKQQAATLWERDRARLYVRFPFLAALASHLEMRAVIDERIPTAATDGRVLYANALLLLHLNEAQRAVLLAHEVWHVALDHDGRRGYRDPERWHLAADHEANQVLRASGMQLPSNALSYADAPSDQAESVYAWLPQQDPGPNPAPQQRPALTAQRLPGSWAIPDMRDDLAQQRDPDVDDPSPGSVGQRHLRRALQCQPGQLPGQLQTLLQRLLTPRVPWQRILAQSLASCLGGSATWSPPSRRSAWSGIYLPSRRSQHLRLAVAMDTSASTAEQANQWWGELRGILACAPRWTVRLVQCDSRIQEDRTIDDRQAFNVAHWPRRGNGGTDFRPLFRRLESDPPPLLVCLSDAAGRFPTQAPPYPVLWVLPSAATPRQPPPFGKVLQVV
ncbi:MAG: hypothetical protein EA402_13305, partial [Planctomycetota bacterium]